MTEIQDGFKDFSTGIRRYQKYHSQAKTERQFPKNVVDMIEDRRTGQKCDFQNFESEKSVRDLHKNNRYNRIFLAQNNLNNKFVDPTEAEIKQKPSERYFLEDLKAPKMTLIAGGTEMSDNMYIENRDHFEGLVKELQTKRIND